MIRSGRRGSSIRCRTSIARRFQVTRWPTEIPSRARIVTRYRGIADRLIASASAPTPSGTISATQRTTSSQPASCSPPAVRSATDVDRILVAGFFAQQKGADNGFGTGEANTLLTEQGVKVGNPSQCVKQNLLAKRVFKHQGRYRVSQIGLDYLRQLIGTALPG